LIRNFSVASIEAGEGFHRAGPGPKHSEWLGYVGQP